MRALSVESGLASLRLDRKNNVKTRVQERQFQGFTRRTFTFLRDLERNNDKRWFHTWYQYKSFDLSCNRKIDEMIVSPDFADQLTTHFDLAALLYRYISRTASRALSE